MADRVIIVRVGENLVSLPFAFVDEILGADRLESLDNVPAGAVPEGAEQPLWVFSRGQWLAVSTLLPGYDVSGSSQIVVARSGNVGRAFAVDRVIGIETPGGMAPFPEKAYRFTDVPIAGVRFRKGGPVLELDLSRLISLDSGS